MSVTITYFVHGTTTDNEAHRSTGWNPGELSELGIKQSKELKDQTDLAHFDAVFSSDLKRAVDSARLNFGDSIEVIQDERLRECNYGDLNGAPSDQVVDADHISEPFPNGESLEDVVARITDFCDYLLANYDGKHIAIVAHKAPQFAFEVIANDKTLLEAIESDWREQTPKAWQPGWEYIIRSRGEK